MATSPDLSKRLKKTTRSCAYLAFINFLPLLVYIVHLFCPHATHAVAPPRFLFVNAGIGACMILAVAALKIGQRKFLRLVTQIAAGVQTVSVLWYWISRVLALWDGIVSVCPVLLLIDFILWCSLVDCCHQLLMVLEKTAAEAANKETKAPKLAEGQDV